MYLGSTSAQYETEVQNSIDLNGGARTVQVNDNSNSSGDFATLSGVISDSVGGATLTKTGPGLLVIRGSAGNTYTGATYITEGNVDLAKTSGYAIPGDLHLSANNGATYTRLLANNQIAPTSVVIFRRRLLAAFRVAWPHLDLGRHFRLHEPRSDREHPV